MATKKGKPAWRPANRITTEDKPGYKARWLINDQMEIKRRMDEGYIIASDLLKNQSPTATDEEVARSNPSTVTTYRDMVLAYAPVEVVKERQDYYKSQTARQEVHPKERMSKGQQEAASTAGIKSTKDLVYIKDGD